jgi:hypothetical protein
MAWTLNIIWSYKTGSIPLLSEAFDTKAEGEARAAEVLADGLTVNTPGRHKHYPACTIRYVDLIEDTEE